MKSKIGEVIHLCSFSLKQNSAKSGDISGAFLRNSLRSGVFILIKQYVWKISEINYLIFPEHFSVLTDLIF